MPEILYVAADETERKPAGFQGLVREREITAELILYLAEVFRRRLYVAEGYPSMHAYCVGTLGMSEDSAGKRIRVVRMARRFPVILDMIADGRLHLSAVCLLAPHLTHENATDLFVAAPHRTRRQIEQLLAERFPQDDVTAMVQPIGPVGPEKSVPGRIWEAASAPRPRVTPLAPQRFAIQFTMEQAMHDDLRRAQELLGHTVAPGEITEVFRRALRELVTKLEKQKFAATDRPRTQKARPAGKPGTSSARRIPAEPKRQVLARDEGRCTFVSKSGHRCESRDALEFDHVVPVARGGASTLENLRPLCRAHYQFETEQAFGDGFMHDIRARAHDAARSRSMPSRAAAP